jgi:uncharacterized protein (DUF983 family)
MSGKLVMIKDEKDGKPACPSCGHQFKAEFEDTGKAIFAWVFFIVLVSFSLGWVRGEYRCDNWGEKRYHYIVPTYYAGCVASRWLDSEKEIFRD